jgi:hypothetical protein
VSDEFENYVGGFIMKTDECNRFGIFNGQFFATYRYKNLWWFLDKRPIGFGDLRDQDISKIQEELVEGEEFVGWNEHHNSHFHQTDTPMIRISPGEVLHRQDIVKIEGH